MIPPHTLTGVIPPYLGDVAAPLHSPYRASMVEVVERFVTSPQRADIMRGFLGLRGALHALGVVSGRQWLDGSYTEKLDREPNDIDVITIFQAPGSWPDRRAVIAANPNVFDRDGAKKHYLVDAYYLESDRLNPRSLLYWYGLFTHRRDTFEWKGLIEVDLAEDDAAAVALLASTVSPDPASPPDDGSRHE